MIHFISMYIYVVIYFIDKCTEDRRSDNIGQFENEKKK